MIKLPHVISTRKLHSNRVAELEAEGWKFFKQNFINKIIDVPANLKREAIQKNVVLTSQSGVAAFLEIAKKLQVELSDYSVHCISQATEKAANAAGLRIQASAPNASALGDEILKDKSIRAVTHICSNRRRAELSEKLKAASVEVQEVVAYRNEFTPVAIDQAYDAILFFSPSAIGSFLSLNAVNPVPCFCIGQTTANHAKQKGYPLVYTADAPSEESLLTILTNHFYKTPAHA